MRTFLLIFIIPAVSSLIFISILCNCNYINRLLFPYIPPKDTIFSHSNFIPTFNSNPVLESTFLNTPINGRKSIFIMGSSELTASMPEVPHIFLNTNFQANVFSYGAGGNQCFSILCQLIANETKLKNKNIVFIISPGWFESTFCKGTSSEVLLNYNSNNFLHNITINDNTYTAYVGFRIAQLFPEFNSPSLEIKTIFLKYFSQKSIIHKIIYYPLFKVSNFLLSKKYSILTNTQNNTLPVKINYSSNSLNSNNNINWEQLFADAKYEVNKNATNNNLGINNAYYTTYVKNKKGRVSPVSIRFNTELKDFEMLVKYVREKDINAYFVIQPINPLYYKNITELDKTMQTVVNEITKPKTGKAIPCLNLYESNPELYDKALLSDVMHLSAYGWLKVNKEIATNYKLTNEE